MTEEYAKKEQDRLSEHFNLSWYYGTHCKKCCGVYPEFVAVYGGTEKCRYECPVCGKTTEPQTMPYLAEAEWNDGNFIQKATQMSFF